MKENVALICVDMQNDFMPGGSLAVNGGDEIVPVVNDLFPIFKTVIFTNDWHPADCCAFASQHEGKAPFSSDEFGQILWPDHCVQGTPGADLYSGIQFGQIFGDFYIFKKGIDKNLHPYSGFEGTALAEFLRERGIDTVYVCGLTTDFCVAATAKDAVKEGFDTYLIRDAARGIECDLSTTYKNLHSASVKMTCSDVFLNPQHKAFDHDKVGNRS